MRRLSIYTHTGPFKRRVHNNYLAFPTIDGGNGFERPKAPISQHLDALEVRTRQWTAVLNYCGLGGHARAPSTAIIVGRTPSLPSPRMKHVLAGPTSQKPRGYVYPQLSCENSAGVATSCTDSRSFLCAAIQIARYHRLQAGGAGVQGVLMVNRAVA